MASSTGVACPESNVKSSRFSDLHQSTSFPFSILLLLHNYYDFAGLNLTPDCLLIDFNDLILLLAFMMVVVNACLLIGLYNGMLPPLASNSIRIFLVTFHFQNITSFYCNKDSLWITSANNFSQILRLEDPFLTSVIDVSPKDGIPCWFFLQ